jgi:hypothetical protein
VVAYNQFLYCCALAMRCDDGFDIDIAFHEAHLTLRDGTPVLIRRLLAEDAGLYPDFLSDLTAEDLRLRFFGPMREVSHALLDKLIHYDPACAKAFYPQTEFVLPYRSTLLDR